MNNLWLNKCNVLIYSPLHSTVILKPGLEIIQDYWK